MGVPGARALHFSEGKGSTKGPDSGHPPTALLSAVQGPMFAATQEMKTQTSADHVLLEDKSQGCLKVKAR